MPSYQVVTYVDRFENGQTWDQPVLRVTRQDWAGALSEAVKSLVIASTQDGLYRSEWRASDPAGQSDPLAESGVPDRALLRANGEIVLDLVALRGHARAGGITPAITHAGTPVESVDPVARPAPRAAEISRSPEHRAEDTQRSPREDAGWSLPELMREEMLCSGCSVGEVARALGDRFDMRPRMAWRHALGWSQSRLALEYNWRYPGASLTLRRVSDRERWPLTETADRRPSPEYLVRLAATYGHRCAPAGLVDAHDLEHLGPIDWATVIPAVRAADKRRRARARRGVTDRSAGARSRRGT